MHIFYEEHFIEFYKAAHANIFVPTVRMCVSVSAQNTFSLESTTCVVGVVATVAVAVAMALIVITPSL